MATRSNSPKSDRQPRVSVVIPAYNTRQTIAETIDSVLPQTYTDYEVIVVDDGSPDGVGDFVVKAYGARIKLIRQVNAGLAGARNAGIQTARGDFVAFLDSDDVWLPEFLESQVALAEAHADGDVFYANCYFWENGRRTGQWTDIHGQKDGDILAELIQRRVMIPVLTTLVRRTAVLKAGLFDASLRQVEDYDLWLRMAAAGSHFYGSPTPLALYRINPGGLSRNTLLMAETQLGVYQRLAKLPTPALRRLVAAQVAIFKLEVLHQKRRLAIRHNDRRNAVGLTLRMIPLRPDRILALIATAVILLISPRLLAPKLAA